MTTHTTPKETDMTTKTPTAAEARALADRLEAEERELTTRRRTARKAAELAQVKAEFAYVDNELETARAVAHARWGRAAAAETLDIVELFDAFVALRRATRERAETLGTANAVANALEPRFGAGGGQTDHRRDWTDVLKDTAFIPALEDVIRSHVDSRGHQANHDTNDRIKAAGTKAEETI